MLSVSTDASEPPIQQILWNGHEVDAYAGHWIVQVDDAGIANLAGLKGAKKAAIADRAGAAAPLVEPMPKAEAMRLVDNWLAGYAPVDSFNVLRSLGSTGTRQMFELETPADTSYDKLESMLGRLPGFQYVEPDFVLTATVTTPNDTQYSSLWGLNNTGQTGGTFDADIDAPEAWDLTTGSSEIVVGVIDSGVDYTHVDLVDNMWTNPGEIPGDGIDNDGNGFVDDIHGWDFANDDNDPFDDRNHGTHVSGTIGAVGNNNQGVVGVNWDVQIMALKFLRNTGSGATSDAVDALNYATMMRHDYGINVRLTSNSWGGGGYSQALYDAIAASRDEDMLFVAAAGNGGPDGVGDNNNVIPFYPASYNLDNIIAVAATNDDDLKAGFSNFGSTSVDLGAPGVSVRSTVPNNGYANFNGTSMATPHVAGVAALAWSIAPDESYQTIRDAIFAGVDPIASMSGITTTGGRLNAAGTLEQLGMRVILTSPARGEVISDLRTDFTVKFTDPYDPATVDASDFAVNGHAADSFTPDTDTITFHYLVSPIEGEGLQTITMADGVIERDSDSEPLHAYTGTFRYDALPLAVVSTVPADGSTAQLPLTSLQVDFNEPYDPATLGINDVVLSQGIVTGFTPSGNSVIYDVAGLVDEGTLSISMPAGSVTDVHGNPMIAYSGSVVLDFGVVPIPTLELVAPEGSLVYDPPVAGSISFAGDTDTFLVFLEEGQSLSVVVDPGAGLRPSLQLLNPSDVPIASALAPAIGSDAVLQTIVAGSTGTYKISLSGNGGSTGAYTLEAILDAAVELESHDGPANNTFGAAQALNAGFTALGSDGSIAAVLGRTQTAAEDWYAFDLALGQRVTLVLKNLSGGGNIDMALAGPTGLELAPGIAGATNADETIHQFVAGADGTFFARVSGAGDTDYSLLVLRDSEFDHEPNNSPGDDLLDLTSVHQALGYLQFDRPPFDGPVEFTLDPVLSAVTLTADIEGVALEPQAGSSLTAQLQGAMLAALGTDTIQFLAGQIDAIAQPGAFQPGFQPADYALQIDLSPGLPGVIAYVASRGVLLDSTSGVLGIDAAGHFNAEALTFAFSQGVLDYSLGPLGGGTVPLNGVTFANMAAGDATLEEIGGVLYVTIPVASSESLIEPNTGLQVNFQFAGQLVGALELPAPIDPEDYYEITLAPGEHLVVSTQTPLDDPGAAPLNTLDPALELLDDSDFVIVADLDSADGKNALFEYTSPGGGTYKIHVYSTAGRGEYVLNVNSSPVLDPIADKSLAEGDTLTFTATAADPDLDALTFSLAPGAPAGASIDPVTGQFSWTPADNVGSPFAITVLVADNGIPQLEDSQSFLVTVDNVAPHITSAVLSGPSLPQPGDMVSLSVKFTDPGILDTHTAYVDWGDGTTSPFPVNEAGGSGGFVAKHTYSAGGMFEIGYVVTDKDGDSAKGTKSLGVSGIGIHQVGDKTALQVVGTRRGDTISITPTWGGRLNIFASFLPRFSYTVSPAGIDFIQILGLGGNDFISLFSLFGGVHLPAIIDGGNGHDTIIGGSGGNVILGGRGRDLIYGGSARDILIGGVGLDSMFGGGNDDILIGGTTSYDNNSPANDLALLDLLKEWSSGRSYNARTANIVNGTGPILGPGGPQLKKGLTVFDDNPGDWLSGGSARDWFFANNNDLLLDKRSNEKLNS